MLMKELVLDAAEETYVTVPTEFINNTECDALYVPQNPLSACPPVFVEAQNQYSTLIFERYSILPILLIIGVSTVATSFMFIVEADTQAYLERKQQKNWMRSTIS
ncbi:unnamed protein product [Rhizopus microsporus]|nr:hypothetical protein RMCBS344292_15881 [Rhizopus microsporus]